MRSRNINKSEIVDALTVFINPFYTKKDAERYVSDDVIGLIPAFIRREGRLPGMSIEDMATNIVEFFDLDPRTDEEMEEVIKDAMTEIQCEDIYTGANCY